MVCQKKNWLDINRTGNASHDQTMANYDSALRPVGALNQCLLSSRRMVSIYVRYWGGSRRSAFHRPASNCGQSANGPRAAVHVAAIV